MTGDPLKPGRRGKITQAQAHQELGSYSDLLRRSERVLSGIEATVTKMRPYLAEAVSRVVASMKMPKGLLSMGNDALDEFLGYRYTSSEIISNIAWILDDSSIFTQLGSYFDEAIKIYRSSVTQEEEGWSKEEELMMKADWESIEAVLASLRVLSRFADDNEPVILHIMQSLPNLTALSSLRKAATHFISKYADWLKHNDQAIVPMLNYCMSCLPLPLCSRFAADAIKEVCRCSSWRLQSHLPTLIDVYNKSDCLPISQQMDLEEAVLYVIGPLAKEEMMEYLPSLVTPMLQKTSDAINKIRNEGIAVS